jgi:hypothetical protein
MGASTNPVAMMFGASTVAALASNAGWQCRQPG